MPDKLKDTLLVRSSVEQLAAAIQAVHLDFEPERFIGLVYDEAWEDRELMDRMRHVAFWLPHSYPQALAILQQVAPSFQGFMAVIFSEFVGRYGLDHWGISLPALAFFTPLASSEFGIRPFLLQDPGKALATMREWAEHDDEHVRRLASEGCRPRLPWGVSLPVFKEDPAPLLPILETLKDDESESVRRSVANNLNDISKSHPDLVLDIGERWLGHSEQRDRLVKHACRTLLKAGNPRALRLFGFGDPEYVDVERLTLDRQTIAIGDDLEYSFELKVRTGKACQVRLECLVYYVKSRGNLSPKVFQIREGSFEPGGHVISRKHSFCDQSTRKHYPGRHQIAIVVNGVEKARAAVELTA
jgi:3-methyladenine DNA glycosylase AlkC